MQSELLKELPAILNGILTHCGYDNIISIRGINDKQLIELERFVQEKLRHVLVGSVYENIGPFCFTPGHRRILLSLVSRVNESTDRKDDQKYTEQKIELLPISFLLKEMIKTEIDNGRRHKNHYRYPDTILYFATYIYMLCGKSCYEVLRANLPFPTDKTIRTYFNITYWKSLPTLHIIKLKIY